MGFNFSKALRTNCVKTPQEVNAQQRQAGTQKWQILKDGKASPGLIELCSIVQKRCAAINNILIPYAE